MFEYLFCCGFTVNDLVRMLLCYSALGSIFTLLYSEFPLLNSICSLALKKKTKKKQVESTVNLSCP